MNAHTTPSTRRHRGVSGLGAASFLAMIAAADCHSPCRADSPDVEVGFAVTRYELDLSFDFESSKLFANCGITLTNRGPAAVEHLPFYLFRTLVVTSVVDAQGREWAFEQRTGSLPDWPQRQINIVDVLAAKPLAAGETVTLRIRYQGFLLGYVELGMSYIQDRVSSDFSLVRQDCDAYPQIRGASWRETNTSITRQRFDYAVTAYVPTRLTVANGGDLVERSVDGAGIRFTYRNIKPVWRMDVAVGDYVILEDGPSRVFAFRRHEEGGRRVLDAMKRTITLYTDLFGPLRDFRGFSVIEVPDGWGSQADVTSIIQSAAAFESRAHMGELYHEVAHQWNVAALDPSPCRVESEGFATFMQFFAEERLDGKQGALEAGMTRLSAGVARAFDRDPRAASVPLIRLGEEGMTDLAYTKGGMFFAVLRELAGPEAFHRIIRRHYEKFAATGATTGQFVETCREISGDGLNKFFDEWLFGAQSSILFREGKSLSEMVARYR